MKFHYRYGLDDKPSPGELLLYGFQWLAITLPGVLIIGKVVGALHYAAQAGEQVLYLQKILFVTGLGLFLQIFLGHRLPLITGPAAVLLIGIIASRGFALEGIYTAILLNGLALFLLGLSGLFGRLQRLFTTTVVAVVLLLIAFSLTPTILDLIAGGADDAPPLARLSFALLFISAMFLVERFLRKIWKSVLIVVAMMLGTILYSLCFDASDNLFCAAAPEWFNWPLRNLTLHLVFDWGVMFSFLFCFLALSINDLGSIQSLKEILDLPDIRQRTRAGIAVTGLTNGLSGFLGVVGNVNYSISPGILLSTGCAARITLLPTAIILMALSFSPAAVAGVASIPRLIIGCVLFHILANQVAAGLSVATNRERPFAFRDGLGVGIPVLLGTVLSFLPQETVAGFPGFFRPIVGNGFVMGVVASLFVEHVLFRHAEEKET